jgi:UDP-GlcNAc:undecaprenyl-phosphate GlcNAc-1-phosphate transferase
VVFRWPCVAGWPLRILALLWIVGLINAFNMLDNMDLLSGGTAWIAAGAFALATILHQENEPDWGAAPFLMLMGALTGFLWFNWPPARIFMGDAGSTFLGFFLGVRALDGGVVDEGNWTTWAVPLCVLAVPWYDLVTVVTLRLRQGRSPFHPDKQHLSHRLAARRLGSVRAVRVIHLFALVSGLAGLAFYRVDHIGAIVLAAGVAAAWAALAAFEYLIRVRSL